MKNDCYTCKHRKDVPGSAHSECVHPIAESCKYLMLLEASQGKLFKNPTHLAIDSGPAQDWNEIGLRNGYVLFPFNFDPCWLNKCLLHESTRTTAEISE